MSSKKAIEHAYKSYANNHSFYAAGTKLRERVNEARKNKMISMDDLSERLNLSSVNALSRILNDSDDKKPEYRRTVTRDIMDRLVAHLGYSAAYLIGYDEPAKDAITGKLDTLFTTDVDNSPLKSVLERFGYTLIGVYSGRMTNINTGQAYWQAEGFETAKEMFDAFISNASEANPNPLLKEWSAASDELVFGEKIFAFKSKTDKRVFYIPKSMYKHFEAYALDMLKPLLSGLLFYDPKENNFEYTGEKPLDDALLIDLRSQEPEAAKNR